MMALGISPSLSALLNIELASPSKIGTMTTPGLCGLYRS